jgi:hypothetical protein
MQKMFRMITRRQQFKQNVINMSIVEATMLLFQTWAVSFSVQCDRYIRPGVCPVSRVEIVFWEQQCGRIVTIYVNSDCYQSAPRLRQNALQGQSSASERMHRVTF